MIKQINKLDKIFYHLTVKSNNKKTGNMPVVTSSQGTCPDDCPFKKGGCYAQGGPLRLHWDRVTRKKGVRFGKGNGLKGSGTTLTKLLKDIRSLPRLINVVVKNKNGNAVVKEVRSRIRLWQAGDMPGTNRTISIPDTKRLVKSLDGMEAFAYTHKPTHIGRNAEAIKYCNDNGVAVNLSANNLKHADELADLGIAPVVSTLPTDAPKNLRTPSGRRVVICPAVLSDHIQCATCGGNKGALCARIDRDYVVGFPAHGSGAKMVSKISLEGQ